jgi:hypothetical protein
VDDRTSRSARGSELSLEGRGGETQLWRGSIWPGESWRCEPTPASPRGGRRKWNASTPTRSGSTSSDTGDRAIGFSPAVCRDRPSSRTCSSTSASRETRHRLVVATTAAGEIFWVEGLRIAEGFKLDKTSRRGLKWTWRRTEGPQKGWLRPAQAHGSLAQTAHQEWLTTRNSRIGRTRNGTRNSGCPRAPGSSGSRSWA